MSPRQIVAVVVRLVAAWLVLQALRTLPAIMTIRPDISPGMLFETIWSVATGAVAVLLWFFPSTIAGKLLPSPSSAAEPSPTADTWLAMGCTLLGMWTLTSTIPHLVFDVLAINYSPAYDDLSQYHHLVISNSVETAIAVWLIL